MKHSRLYKDDWAVNSRLEEVFDVQKSDFYPIVREVVGARADATDNDPIFSAGLFGHIHGVRNIRALFRTKGWNNLRKNGNELVKHPDKELFVGYSAVDLACSDNEHQTPKAISRKGDGAKAAIKEAQLDFLSQLDDQYGQFNDPINLGLWYLCVSVNDDDVRAEISLSDGIVNGNFGGFIERIFIIQKDEWNNIGSLSNPDGNLPSDDALEFEPKIIRK